MPDEPARRDDALAAGSPVPADALVASPLARRLLRLARTRPGVGLREATRALEASWATLAYHRRRLEREGLLRVDVEGRRHVLYAEEPGFEGTLGACRAMLEGGTLRRVARFVQAHGPTSREEVCRRLDLSPNAAAHHLHRLIAAGLVVAQEGSLARLEGLAPAPLLDLLLGEPEPAASAAGAEGGANLADER